METYIKTVLESLKEDNLNIPELREFLERELRECWKEAEKEGKKFAEWANKMCWDFDEDKDKWAKINNGAWDDWKGIEHTTEQLFNQFKKENNL